jgi:hypothetical protein
MADPLSDPRARDLLAADPFEVAGVAYTLRSVSLEAQAVAGGLRGAPSYAEWWGESAETFRNTIGNYPAQVDKVHSSYGEAASALNHYEGELASLQSSFRTVQQQLESARSHASALTSQLGGQGQQLAGDNLILREELNAHARPTAAQLAADASAGEKFAATAGALERAQREVSGLEGHAFRILDTFANERKTVAGKLSAAANLAPKSPPWWERALDDVGHFVVGVGKGIGSSVWNLVSGKVFIAFWDHPGWSTFGEIVKDIAVTASLVAMIAAPFAAPELAEGEIALEATAEGGDAAAAAGDGAAADSGGATFWSVARGVNQWGNRVALGGNGLGAVDQAGQGNWGAAGVSAAFMLAPNLGSMPKSVDDVKGFGDVVTNLFHIGDGTAETAASAAEQMRDFKLLEEWGVNGAGARSLAFPNGEPPGVLGNVNLEDPNAVSAVVKQLDATAAGKAAIAMHYGKPAAYLIDSLITDPSHDAINHRLHLVPEEGG